MKRILIVNVNWLGDCIMTFPAFRAIKEKYPSSYVGVMVVPRLEEVFRRNPYIDEIIGFDERALHKGLFSKIMFIEYLREKRFDTVFLIHRSFTRACICMLAGIKNRVGFKRLKTACLLTMKVAPPKGEVHRAEYYFTLLQKCGIPIKDKVPHFFLSDQERSEAEESIQYHRTRHKYFVALNPSANWELKRWPSEYFIKVIEELTKREVCVFLIGARKDCVLTKEIGACVSNNVVDFCGKTTVRQLAALLDKMDMVLSADSGPAHLAASLGKPVLVLFGPTSPGITAPYGPNVEVLRKDVNCAIPCYNIHCSDNICMKKITPQDVLTRAWEILENG